MPQYIKCRVTKSLWTTRKENLFSPVRTHGLGIIPLEPQLGYSGMNINAFFLSHPQPCLSLCPTSMLDGTARPLSSNPNSCSLLQASLRYTYAVSALLTAAQDSSARRWLWGWLSGMTAAKGHLATPKTYCSSFSSLTLSLSIHKRWKKNVHNIVPLKCNPQMIRV